MTTRMSAQVQQQTVVGLTLDVCFVAITGRWREAFLKKFKTVLSEQHRSIMKEQVVLDTSYDGSLLMNVSNSSSAIGTMCCGWG